jgi:hypothetical protein
MHKIKRRMLSSSGETTSITHSYETMGIDRNRFHRTVPRSRWVQLPMGSYMQIIIDGTLDTAHRSDFGAKCPQSSTTTRTKKKHQRSTREVSNTDESDKEDETDELEGDSDRPAVAHEADELPRTLNTEPASTAAPDTSVPSPTAPVRNSSDSPSSKAPVASPPS